MLHQKVHLGIYKNMLLVLYVFDFRFSDRVNMTGLCLLICGFLGIGLGTVRSQQTASVTWDQSSNKFSLHKGVVQDYVAMGAFRNEINSTG